jgi:hypothetical protein
MGPALVLILAVCIALLAGCDLPRRVRDQAETAPPLPAGSIEVDPQAQVEPPPVPANLNRPTLPNATVIEAPDRSLEGLAKLDIAAARSTDRVAIEVNDELFAPRLEAIFDGDTESLARTENVNPMILTLTFPAPIKLRVARVYLAGSPYDWLLEPVVGEDRHLRRNVPERTWSAIDLPEAVETSAVRIEALRLERDDYVHVNEIELWVEP